MKYFQNKYSCILNSAGILMFLIIINSAIYAQNHSNAGDQNNSISLLEERIRAYLVAINSGSHERILNFTREHSDSTFLKQLPMHIIISIHMGEYYKSGGLGYDLHEIRSSEKNGLVAVVHNRLTDAWLNLRIPVSPSPPHKIMMFAEFEPIPPPSGFEQRKRIGDQEIVKRLQICLDRMVKDDEFSGAVLFALNGVPLFKKAYGLADKSHDVPNRLDTRFNTASLGKMFTGVAVAQLFEKGKLLPNDPLSKFVPVDWLQSEVSRTIQIQNLLTHTSGLGDYFKKLYDQPTPQVYRGLEDYRPLVVDQIPAFDPGTRWSYSNTGFLLLGVVIEDVSKEDYFDYLRNHIYKPAGMTNTDAYDKDSPVLNAATGYMKEYTGSGMQWRSNIITRVMKGGPSGGSMSTVEDLLKFDIALRNHKLLNPKYTEIVLSSKPEINSPFYGYGFFIDQSAAGRIAGHGGDGTGISSQFKMYLDLNYSVIVLSNYNVPAASIVEEVIHQMILSNYMPKSKIEE